MAQATPCTKDLDFKVTTHIGVNGKSYILEDGAKALAQYPHMREVNGLLFVSGTSSRRPDNTHRGADRQEDGSWKLDIEEQTRGVIENIRSALRAAGRDLTHVVDLTTYLVDMRDYPGYNRAYNEYFATATGPTRTTITVHQLPHPNLLIEIRAVVVAATAAAPSASPLAASEASVSGAGTASSAVPSAAAGAGGPADG